MKSIFTTFLLALLCLYTNQVQSQNDKSFTENEGFKKSIVLTISPTSKYSVYDQKIPSITLGFERIAFRELTLDKPIIGMGPGFGYNQHSFGNEIFTNHTAWTNFKVYARAFPIAELIAKQDIPLGKILDVYLGYNVGYGATLNSESGYYGNVFHGLILGTRVYYKSIGAVLELGKTTPWGGGFNIGIVFRR